MRKIVAGSFRLPCDGIVNAPGRKIRPSGAEYLAGQAGLIWTNEIKQPAAIEQLDNVLRDDIRLTDMLPDGGRIDNIGFPANCFVKVGLIEVGLKPVHAERQLSGADMKIHGNPDKFGNARTRRRGISPAPTPISILEAAL